MYTLTAVTVCAVLAQSFVLAHAREMRSSTFSARSLQSRNATGREWKTKSVPVFLSTETLGYLVTSKTHCHKHAPAN